MKIFKIYSKDAIIANIYLLVLSIFIGCVAFILTDTINKLYNIGILENNFDVFIHNFIKYIILLFILFFIHLLYGIYDYKAHWQGMKNIKVALLDKILNCDYSIFNSNSAPMLCSDIDLTSFQLAKLYRSIIAFFSKTIECILLSYLVFKISNIAGIVVIIIVPIISLTNIWINKQVNKRQQAIIEGSRVSSQLNIETLNSINNIKVKNKYKFFLNSIEKTIKNLQKNQVINHIFLSYWDLITKFIINVIPLIIIYIMISRFELINIDIGNIIALYTVIPLMLTSFRKVFSITIDYSVSKPSLDKVTKILSYKDDILGNKKIDSFNSLKMTDVNIKYNDGNIVTIPNLQVKKGEKVLIVGESGKGKSTIFDIIMGIKKDYNGIVQINGDNIKELDIRSIRRMFGISYQENKIFNMSLEENIVLGRKSKFLVQDIIDDFVLSDLQKSRNGQYIDDKTVSGGESSRIALAQNIYGDPDVILIDESLSSVDEIIEVEIMKSLLEKYKDKTFICISHRKSSEKYFDRVVCV